MPPRARHNESSVPPRRTSRLQCISSIPGNRNPGAGVEGMRITSRNRSTSWSARNRQRIRRLQRKSGNSRSFQTAPGSSAKSALTPALAVLRPTLHRTTSESALWTESFQVAEASGMDPASSRQFRAPTFDRSAPSRPVRADIPCLQVRDIFRICEFLPILFLTLHSMSC